MQDNGNVLPQVDPTGIRRIHLVGVAGTGMGSFAGMLKAAGYQVSGSDEKVYPPMSEVLAQWGIPVMTPYAPSNLDLAKPDLVIIGNVIRRVNPEATEVRKRRLPQMSFPAAVGSLFLGSRHPAVVVGTHGKTTSSALLGHVLVEAGRDPSFLLGGVTENYGSNFRLGKGELFVIEGDEYDTAYFDKGPKFLHYRPRTAILTSVELDHADIYLDLDHYQSAFDAFVRLLPEEGTLAVCASYPNAVQLSAACRAQVITYSARLGVQAHYTAEGVQFSPEGAQFTAAENGKPVLTLRLQMGGLHNVENAIGVFAAGRSLGLPTEEIAKGLATFRGVKRRQQVRAEINGVLIIDDFAHHPTAVKETIAAVRQRYPQRRLWAVFEPRSNTSRRNIHQQAYASAFTGANLATVKMPEPHDKVPADQQLDVAALVEELKSGGIEANSGSDVGELAKRVASKALGGDLILVMSNGSFGGFIEKLIGALQSAR
jgi:UDP-N-acetylmuramate: L-alanyl-gamma-D-glutamyl-meso-diaminopimelate ligase